MCIINVSWKETEANNWIIYLIKDGIISINLLSTYLLNNQYMASTPWIKCMRQTSPLQNLLLSGRKISHMAYKSYYVIGDCNLVKEFIETTLRKRQYM